MGLFAVILFLFICDASRAFMWSASVQDLAELYACVGDTVTLPWNFSLAEGESVEDIKWYYQREDLARQSVAATVDGTFFPLPAFAHRVDHVTLAGIRLHNVTDDDTGNYSVLVTVLRGTTFTTFQHSSTLTIATNPLVSTRGSHMTLQQERIAVYDNSTGQFHVQLTCGSLRISGNPPVEVEFAHPSGQKDVVSEHDRGNFSLLLPNPVEGGNYVCRLLAVYPPVSCLPATSNVLSSVTVSIDEVGARMSLIEAEQRALHEENARLREENSRLNDMLFINQTLLRQDIWELGEQVTQLQQEKPARHVSFQVQLSSDLTVFSSSPVHFNKIINNDGDTYNVSAGSFTAPSNGTYFFAATCAPVTADVVCFIETSTERVCQAMASYGRPYSDTTYRKWAATCHASLHLAEGDSVWVTPESSSTFGGLYTSFSGFSVGFD